MILSVSRRTDIPSYYSQWFFNRLQEGFLYVKNPMNPHQISQIDLSPDTIDGMVFWTKNPEPMIPRLELLKHIPYYFQFTLAGAVFKDIKDTNQRRACQCLASVEVGTYHTCQNGCLYCYANQNAQRVQENYRIYDPHFPLLCGTVDPEDRITKRLTKSLKESQLTLPFSG